MCVSVADGNDDDGDIEKGMIKYVFSYHIISFGKKIWNFFLILHLHFLCVASSQFIECMIYVNRMWCAVGFSK